MSRIRLGTRGSRLALVQARQVRTRLLDANPGLGVEIVEITTSGDRIVDVPLGPNVGQSFFTKEIEDALLTDRVDIAVHSCKDLATVLPPGLGLGAVLAREDPRDVLVGSAGVGFADLPGGSRIGTASIRRKSFLGLARPDLVLEDLRGNVPTRLKAVDEGRVDAVVLAAAGLLRLGMGARITEFLAPDILPPAAAQGAVAIQVRTDDATTRAVIERIDDPRTRSAVTAERACLRRLGAGCQAPVGCIASVTGRGLTLRTSVITPGGRLDRETSGSVTAADAVGERCAEAILRELGVTTLLEAGDWTGPSPQRRSGP